MVWLAPSDVRGQYPCLHFSSWRRQVGFVALDGLADQNRDHSVGSGPILGIRGVGGITDWPQGFSLSLVSESCTQSHGSSPMTHFDVGVRDDVSIPSGVLRGSAERCYEQNSISVWDVHHRLCEDASGDRAGHRDEAHLVTLPLVPKAPTAESIYKNLCRCEKLEHSCGQHICSVGLVRFLDHETSVTPLGLFDPTTQRRRCLVAAVGDTSAGAKAARLGHPSCTRAVEQFLCRSVCRGGPTALGQQAPSHGGLNNRVREPADQGGPEMIRWRPLRTFARLPRQPPCRHRPRAAQRADRPAGRHRHRRRLQGRVLVLVSPFAEKSLLFLSRLTTQRCCLGSRGTGDRCGRVGRRRSSPGWGCSHRW